MIKATKYLLGFVLCLLLSLSFSSNVTFANDQNNNLLDQELTVTSADGSNYQIIIVDESEVEDYIKLYENQNPGTRNMLPSLLLIGMDHKQTSIRTTFYNIGFSDITISGSIRLFDANGRILTNQSVYDSINWMQSVYYDTYQQNGTYSGGIINISAWDRGSGFASGTFYF